MLTLHTQKAEEQPSTDVITKTVTGTITLPFYEGSTDFAVLYSSEVEGMITATVNLGSALGCSAKRIVNNAPFDEISTTENKATGATAENALTITLSTSADDVQFKPSSISFNACKIATDGGKFDLSLDGTKLYSAVVPNRNNETGGFYSSYSKQVSSSFATEHNFVYNIYALQNKCMGLGSIVITGELTYMIEIQKGDVNADGQIDISDVVVLVNYILTSNADNIHLGVADINDDDSIDISDVVELVNIILGQ